MSMQEEQARHAAEEQARGTSSPPPSSAGAASSSTLTHAGSANASIVGQAVDPDEEAMLAQALAMSEGKDVDMDGEGGRSLDHAAGIEITGLAGAGIAVVLGLASGIGQLATFYRPVARTVTG